MSSPSATGYTTECPLHIAIRELAHLAVAQHVLYLEGECLPRPEILTELDRWSTLHKLIFERVCVACRTSRIGKAEFDSAVEPILSRGPYPTDSGTSLFQQDLTVALANCRSCAEASICPLGASEVE